MLALLRTLTLLVLASFAVGAVTGLSATQTRNARLAPVPLSNAVRLARGLPPLAPRRLFSPTNVRRSVPSNVPGPITYGGVIQIVNHNAGTVVGYVTFSNGNTGGNYVRDRASAPTFTFTQPSDPAGATTLVDSTGTQRVAVGGRGWLRAGVTLTPTSYNALGLLTTTLDLPANSPPVTDSANGVDLETAVWQIDPVTFKVTPVWTNIDHSQPGSLGFAVGGGWVYMISGTNFLRNQDTYLVDLVFVPSSAI